MRTENTDQLRLGHWLIEADRRCGQMSVEYDMDRLAATAIKCLDAAVLCRNNTQLCVHVYPLQIVCPDDILKYDNRSHEGSCFHVL